MITIYINHCWKREYVSDKPNLNEIRLTISDIVMLHILSQTLMSPVTILEGVIPPFLTEAKSRGLGD